jgi:hypothetical protein
VAEKGQLQSALMNKAWMEFILQSQHNKTQHSSAAWEVYKRGVTESKQHSSALFDRALRTCPRLIIYWRGFRWGFMEDVEPQGVEIDEI